MLQFFQPSYNLVIYEKQCAQLFEQIFVLENFLPSSAPIRVNPLSFDLHIDLVIYGEIAALDVYANYGSHKKNRMVSRKQL